MAKIDTNSGLYALAQNSRTVSGKDPIVVTKPTTTNKYAAVLQAQANAGVANPSVAGESATRHAQYAAVLNQNVNPGKVAGSVAGENVGRPMQTIPETNNQEEPVNVEQNPVVPKPNAVQPVTYIDNNGEKQTGYVNAEAAPAEEGSEAATEELDYWERMAEQYDAIYRDAVAANDAQAAAAADRAKMAAEEQIAALAAQYAGTNRQLYRDYMETKKALPQQLAAMGYSGGMSESARLRLGMSYEEALAENERARIAGVAGINSTQAQNIYEIEAAAAEANRQALLQQQQNMLQLDAEKRQYEIAAAETMATSGDFSGYLKLGYTQEEVDYLTRLWLQQNPDALNTWVDSHPEEAERLGVKKKTTKKSSPGNNGYFSQYDQSQYINAVGSDLEQAKNNGASNAEIAKAIDAEYSSGNITQNGKDLLYSKLL